MIYIQHILESHICFLIYIYMVNLMLYFVLSAPAYSSFVELFYTLCNSSCENHHRKIVLYFCVCEYVKMRKHIKEMFKH